MPTNINNINNCNLSMTSKSNRINHSTSFVLGNSCLDTCPKCGQNICEHTSIADVINLPNSLSQDFSTYSSDSSLIKQLFNESTSSTATTISNFNFPDLNPGQISLTAINQLINMSKTSANLIPSIRPLSCQVVLENKTTELPQNEVVEKKIKKKKFRLFFSHKEESAKPSPSRHLLRSSGLVNCLTSSGSSSSSSFEDLKRKSSKKKPLREQVELSLSVPPSQSVVSLNSKLTHEVDDENAYNELQTFELCPIVAIEEDYEESKVNKTNSEPTQPSKSFISVKLNNYFYYDYEKKANSCTSTLTDSSTEITEIHRPALDYSSSTTATLTRPLIQPKLNLITNLDPKTETSKTRLSYFSTCSSCESNKTSIYSTNSSNSSNTATNNIYSAKYHTITVIFVLIGLFTINFLQESLLLFYYFNTEQFYWFIYSLIALFSGQTITLILSLLAEIDLVNLSTPKLPRRQPLFINETSSSSNTNEPTSSNNQLYSVYKNPFSKLCLLIPGYLPISVYIQFFKHVLNYKKSPAHVKFKLEFQLSLYLFFNAMFFSLPLVIINSCYLASTTRLNSSSWYYTEVFSLFSHYPTTSIAAYLLNPTVSTKSQFILLLVSIFISISIGICLFITYYELMKQMSFFAQMLKSKMSSKPNDAMVSLGPVEILVYFCYRFCLITSRLAILGLFWYLFNEWLFLFVIVHILLGYLCSFCTVKEITSKSKLNQHLTLFIICLLSFVDLFMNQLTELYHIRKIFFYYILYFVQNVSILTYWLVRTILGSRQLEMNSNQTETEKTFRLTPAMTACYATLIYLCVILFTIFGLILKFLHLHILRKRYRRTLSDTSSSTTSANTVTANSKNLSS